MTHIHQLDCCDDDQCHPHHIRFLNHQSTPVTVGPVDTNFPFIPASGFTVPGNGHTDVDLRPNITPGTYHYDVKGCTGKKSPKTIIIS
jgi:hypothetical protein